jgi:hypothetical protein
MAYSATTVLPALVWAETSTLSFPVIFHVSATFEALERRPRTLDRSNRSLLKGIESEWISSSWRGGWFVLGKRDIVVIRRHRDLVADLRATFASLGAQGSRKLLNAPDGSERLGPRRLLFLAIRRWLSLFSAPLS